MSTTTSVPVEEYLHTSYEPDCDYVDGVLIERNAGELEHSWLQTAIAAHLWNRRKEWNITPLIEQRVRLREGKYMAPDVCVLAGPKPKERIITTPPLIWIEILSSEDRPVRVSRKVQDALTFGCPYVWVIDPETLESYVATPEGQKELPNGVLSIHNTEIQIPLHRLEEDSIR